MQQNKKVVAEKQKKNRFLLIFVCIFVSVVIVFGVVLGIITAVKNKNAVVSYGGVVMDEKVTTCLSTRFKSTFMSEIPESEDSPGFWNSKDENGKTYGERLVEECEDYLKYITIANYLFDRYTKLTSDEKDYIEGVVEFTLSNSFGGDEDRFNEAAAIYGFDYSSYCEAVKMCYKANKAESIICGVDGANLKGNTEAEENYISQYSCVLIMSIRTETTFRLDASGNRIQMGDGSYDIRKLTDEEKADRAAYINEIREYISTGSMTLEYFVECLNSKYYDGDVNTKDSGYYFHPKSEFTYVFGGANPSIVEKSFELSVGDFGEAKFTESDADGNRYDTGVCFIYKIESSVSDLSSSVYSDFFVDFYSDLSTPFYWDQIYKLVDDVEVKDAFYDIDLKLLPYNSEITNGLKTDYYEKIDSVTKDEE